MSIITVPEFGTGQRAFLVQTKSGNLLWDCGTFLDKATIDAIQKVGGIQAIAVSHPHFYSSIAEWSKAFDNAPVYLHSSDKQWVANQPSNLIFWAGG
jgi:glyoxylase-like metal-dependent hydrolase (beta-lactamase superfamily II)